MDLATLQQQLHQAKTTSQDAWCPRFCGDIPIRINRDGQWLYQGSPIHRQPLVKLLRSVLHYKDGDYLLTTPVEQVRIQVDDAPFLLHSGIWHQSDNGQILQVTSNLAEDYLVSAEYPVILQPDPLTGQQLPYLQLPRGLTAKFSRNLFYQLAEVAQPVSENQTTQWWLQSGNYGFCLGQFDASDDL